MSTVSDTNVEVLADSTSTAVSELLCVGGERAMMLCKGNKKNHKSQQRKAEKLDSLKELAWVRSCEALP